MKLLEYEAKNILRIGDISVPTSTLIKSTGDMVDLPTVLKSQVPVGGRGKLGGVVVVEDTAALNKAVDSLFNLDIKGYKPNTILAEEKLDIAAEHYVSLLVDRSSASIRLVAHKNGGIEVEDNSTEDFLNLPIDNTNVDDRADKLAAYLGYDVLLIKPLLVKLYSTFIKNDVLLLEINPLVYTKNGDLVCGDCKMELDDAAAFRHPDWNFEEKPSDANFVVLNKKGTIATIANGAGLAMATVDAVAARGMTPANFLDIGGGANTESVLKAFRKIVEFENIQAIVINIFAGITRCDEVARAIIAAKEQIDTLPPLFIRLAGTNFEEAVTLLEAQNIATLPTLEKCLSAAKEASRE
ncbi:MAG TPA: ATP-grasp domain-containing protein [Candidatus Saccharimonadales bacterium]|nr:ATP-grasp domain-containing protein [Candidatus Saccharimonadales bacterium]